MYNNLSARLQEDLASGHWRRVIIAGEARAGRQVKEKKGALDARCMYRLNSRCRQVPEIRHFVKKKIPTAMSNEDEHINCIALSVL